jgi:putative peptidoglycan lipid II flippase
MVRLFTASKDTRTPAWVGLASIAVNALGGWLLMHVWGHWGIALVISLVSYVNTLVLYLIFRHRYGPLDEGLLSRSLLTHLTLAIILGGSLFYLGQPLAKTPGSLMTVEHVLDLAGIVAIAGGLYLALGLLFKVEEIRALIHMIKRRIARIAR